MAPRPSPRLEAERAGREARRDVEEVVGQDVALEERDRVVAPARGRESARGEVVEPAVRVALGGLDPQRAEPLEDLGPLPGPRRRGERLLARGSALPRAAQRRGRRRERRREG